MKRQFVEFWRTSGSAGRAGFLACVITLLLGGEALSQPVPGRTLCFYVDKGLPGHCFVQFNPLNNAQAGNKTLCRGKYPANKFKIFGGPGIIKDDSRRAWDQRICYPVGVAQYNGAAAKVNGKQAAPPAYNLLWNPPGNCVHWMSDVAAAAGLVLPNKFGFFGIATPGSFGTALKAIGNGGGFAGGTVAVNPNTNIAPDGGAVAVVTPNDWDAEEVALLLNGDPAGLAGAMGLPLNSVYVGDFTTTPGALFDVQAGNASADEALIVMDWGDGSALEAQQVDFSHTYDAGIYLAVLSVADCGAVNVYEWSVEVSEFLPEDSVAVNVPTPTCFDDTNDAAEFPPGSTIQDEAAFCGNDLREEDEQCDGTDDAKCEGNCQPDCTCAPGTKIPAVSEWGLSVMLLLVLTAATVVLGQRRRTTPA